MRTYGIVLTLLLASLLFGCGGAEKAQEETAPKETAPEETTVSERPVAVAPDVGVPETTLGIINDFGEVVVVRVEVADTNTEQTRGLMERTELAADAGMLFAFEEPLQGAFTMRNTQLPLSIAFIDAQGVIVDILDMQPFDETTRYAPTVPYLFALEVNQGFFAERAVGLGNVVELPPLFSSARMSGTAEAIQSFRDADLEVGEVFPVDEEPDWQTKPVPKTYTEGTRFTIPSLGEDYGGRVFVFATEGDLAAVRDYYEGLDEPLRPYVYVEGNVLLQMTNLLPEAEVENYRAAL